MHNYNLIRRATESGLAGLFLWGSIGCGRNAIKTPRTEPSLPVEIQSVIAAKLHKSPDSLTLDSTFAALGADDLDIVEITMAVEGKMGIRIDDAKLRKAAGTVSHEDLSVRLTLGAFANVASTSAKRFPTNKGTVSVPNREELSEAQVGSYGELSRKPNPLGFALVFVPSLEELIGLSERQLGRTMTQGERDALKAKAVVIALPQAVAEKMKQERAKRDVGQ